MKKIFLIGLFVFIVVLLSGCPIPVSKSDEQICKNYGGDYVYVQSDTQYHLCGSAATGRFIGMIYNGEIISVYEYRKMQSQQNISSLPYHSPYCEFGTSDSDYYCVWNAESWGTSVSEECKSKMSEDAVNQYIRRGGPEFATEFDYINSVWINAEGFVVCGK